jgi:hypothetical protein
MPDGRIATFAAMHAPSLIVVFVIEQGQLMAGLVGLAICRLSPNPGTVSYARGYGLTCVLCNCRQFGVGVQSRDSRICQELQGSP